MIRLIIKIFMVILSNSLVIDILLLILLIDILLLIFYVDMLLLIYPISKIKIMPKPLILNFLHPHHTIHNRQYPLLIPNLPIHHHPSPQTIPSHPNLILTLINNHNQSISNNNISF